MGVMPEEGFLRDSTSERQTWRSLFQTFSDGIKLVRGRSILLAILFISAIYGLSSAGFDNLWTVNMLENLSFPAIGDWEPVVWFGIFNGTVSVLGLLGTEIARRRVDTSHQSAIMRTLMFLTGATATCMVIYGLTTNFWLAAVVYCLSVSLRTTSDPLLRTWINQNAESKVRATVLSMDSQLNSLGQSIGGPVIGAIGSTFSLPAALVTTGLARVPVTFLFARLVFRGKNTQNLDSSEGETS
jgi:hypothetical protein